MPRLLLVVILFFSYLLNSYVDGDEIEVGSLHPIVIQYRDGSRYDSAGHLAGTNYSVVGSGNIGKVYLFSDGVAKAIPLKLFKNGDEIRAAKIISDLGLGPQFYDAWVTTSKKNNQEYVIMHMENLGDSISGYIPKLVRNDPFSLQHKFEKLFSNRQDGTTYFYDRFFSILLMLAQNNVSWVDAHFGNFMYPKYRYAEMKIIDFDSCKIHESASEAASTMLTAPYIHVWVERFENLPDEKQGEIALDALNQLMELAQQ